MSQAKRSGAAMAEDAHYLLFDTAIGRCGLAWSGRGLTRLALPERDAEATEQRLRKYASSADGDAVPAWVQEAIGEVRRYMGGEPVTFAAVVVDLAGAGEFDRSVYAVARALPWGRTVTYGELARRAGAPEMARAVGHALSRNPVPVVIPCHRILAQGDKIGGFSAFGGAATKERLLALEGIRPGADAPPLPGLLD